MKINKDSRVSVEISYKTIMLVFLLAIAGWLIFQIKDILFGFFIALILVGSLNPTVVRLEKRGLPRWLAVLSIYILLILVLTGVLAGIIPPLIVQMTDLMRSIPEFVDKIKFLPINTQYITAQFADLISLPSGVLRFTLSVFSNVVSVLALSVVTFYMLIEHDNIDNYLFELFGEMGRKRGERIIRKLEIILGEWVRAQLVLMIFVGLLSYLGFLILGLKFALPLGLLAAILEIVPNLGPTLAAIPAVLLGFAFSPIQGVATLAWCILVQQIENNFLVPRVMSRVVGINPVATLLSLAIGLRLAGTGGAILAIPVYLSIKTVVSEFVSKTRKPDSV